MNHGFVKCINNTGMEHNFILGKVYPLLSRDDGVNWFNLMDECTCKINVNRNCFVRTDVGGRSLSDTAIPSNNKKEYQEITEDNFQQVWFNSNIGCNETTYSFESSQCPVKEITFSPYNDFWIIKSTLGSIHTKSFTEFLDFIHKRFTLKPLPVPKFDFEEYINNNVPDWKKIIAYEIFYHLYEGKRPSCKLDESNAEIICEIYELIGKLKAN